MDDFATLVKGRREALGVSLRELSAMIGMDHTTLCRVERGADVRLSTVKALVRALELNPHEVLR